ncbi:hypothetical protein [Leptospira mtsangambouensis]|uniref:hypothetical protein n=1 Tax=Leptospira mtsangambouensis TaxID=2484912 RepID=UPI001EEB37F9|nr:hypothetical protein [Leptospira mtsangambouensis]MCG6142684.1 hypothetical protein [Leptospira mtsangambouensis]
MQYKLFQIVIFLIPIFSINSETLFINKSKAKLFSSDNENSLIIRHLEIFEIVIEEKITKSYSTRKGWIKIKTKDSLLGFLKTEDLVYQHQFRKSNHLSGKKLSDCIGDYCPSYHFKNYFFKGENDACGIENCGSIKNIKCFGKSQKIIKKNRVICISNGIVLKYKNMYILQSEDTKNPFVYHDLAISDKNENLFLIGGVEYYEKNQFTD